MPLTESVQRLRRDIKSDNRRIEDRGTGSPHAHERRIIAIAHGSGHRAGRVRHCARDQNRRSQTRKFRSPSSDNSASRTALPISAFESLSEKLMPSRSALSRSSVSRSTYQTLSPLAIRPCCSGRVTSPDSLINHACGEPEEPFARSRCQPKGSPGPELTLQSLPKPCLWTSSTYPVFTLSVC